MVTYARASELGGRVELRLHESASTRQYRELGAFVRYCVHRIERDLEPAQRWAVKIVPTAGAFCCEVIVRHRASVVQSKGVGLDGPLAAWDALCRIEQLMRDNVVDAKSGGPEAVAGGR
jgi:hypothetical protein